MGFLSDLAYSAAWKIEMALRKNAQLDIKMEIFTTSYLAVYTAKGGVTDYDPSIYTIGQSLVDIVVIDREIPICISRPGADQKYHNNLMFIETDPAGVLCKDNWTRFPSCYVRTVGKKGWTKFHWFHHFGMAKDYANKFCLDGNYVEVIGPYNMPMGKDDRFH